MDNVCNFIYIGKVVSKKSDKIWGIAEIVKNRIYIKFWGRKDTKYRIQLVKSSYFSIRKMIDEKTSEYTMISKNELLTIYPTLIAEINSASFWTIMLNMHNLTLEEFDLIKETIDTRISHE